MPSSTFCLQYLVGNVENSRVSFKCLLYKELGFRNLGFQFLCVAYYLCFIIHHLIFSFILPPYIEYPSCIRYCAAKIELNEK